MHRVELKEFNCIRFIKQVFKFLMHRVELKGGEYARLGAYELKVPNAPCGVESRTLRSALAWEPKRS